MANPADLNITTQPDTDKNFFNFKAVGLKVDEAYAIKFQWVYSDGTVSDWSPGKLVTTNAEPIPGAPVITVEGGAGFIKIGLATFPSNAFRVDIRISGGTFGSGTVVVDSFTSAGTKTITAAGAAGAGAPYTVSAITISPTKTGVASTPVTVYVTDPTSTLVVAPSATPSTPTVSSVVGAIQLSWNGKKADGGDQPAGFKAAKVYVGTSSNFTPIDSGNQNANQVDVLDFGNGQNTLNIGVGTLVNGVAITYDTDYYVKIKTTNGNAAEDSAVVSATGNPAQIGKVGNNGLIEITADKITTGTLQSNSTITVGAPAGRRVELRGNGVPFEIFGTGGSSLLSYNASSNKLSITGEGTFSGALQAASGDFTGSLQVGSSSNPVITNITSDGTYLTVFAKTILAVGDVISISGVRSSNAFVTVTNAVGNGTTVTYTGTNTFSVGETVTVSGITPFQYNLKGVISSRTNSQFVISSNKTGAFISAGVAGYPHAFDLNSLTVNRITDAAGNHITTSGVDVYAESFRVVNSTSGSYTSGGSIVRSAFQVGSTGILKAAEGIIGGWLINGSKLVSSGTVNRIELDPLTPAITLKNSLGDIQISASNGISHSSGSFTLTPGGNLTISGVITANSGSNIAGWQTTSTAISAGGVSLNSSGSVVSTGNLTGFLGTSVATTSTLSSGYLDLFSNENTVAFLGMADGLTSGGGAIIRNSTNQLKTTAVGVRLEATSLQNGVPIGGFYITHASGDYDVHFGLFDTASSPTTRRFKFDHWNNTTQRNQDNYAAAFDTQTQGLRPLVIDTDGGAGLGWSQYFSTTQTTTPSSGTGSNGDIYLSTA